MLSCSRGITPMIIAATIACNAPVRHQAAPVPPPSAAAAQATPADATTDSPAPYKGPAVTITLNKNGTPAATVKVTFTTGGWELKRDSSRVKDTFGVVHLTFAGPGPDDMAAQVMQEKTWEWESSEPFARAEVWVRIARRGQAPPSEYRLAAKAP